MSCIVLVSPVCIICLDNATYDCWVISAILEMAAVYLYSAVNLDKIHSEALKIHTNTKIDIITEYGNAKS